MCHVCHLCHLCVCVCVCVCVLCVCVHLINVRGWKWIQDMEVIKLQNINHKAPDRNWTFRAYKSVPRSLQSK